MNQLPVLESERSVSCCRWSLQMASFCCGVVLTAVGVGGYCLGKFSQKTVSDSTTESSASRFVPPEYLNATASHGGSNMAVCTGRVDENAEGFFALDYLTGELKGWVFNPRTAAFGGFFVTNVQPALGVSIKNPEYLLVTGDINANVGGQSTNVRPAGTLVYVVDLKSGFFAAYTIPWSTPTANSGAPQSGTFNFVGGGQIREPQGGGKKPINPPKAPGPAAPGNNAGAAAPGPQAPGPGVGAGKQP